jgi:hypothetical protein
MNQSKKKGMTLFEPMTLFNFRTCYILIQSNLDAVTIISKMPFLRERAATLTIDETIELLEKNMAARNKLNDIVSI